MGTKATEIETGMLLIWTIIFIATSFPLNAWLFRDETPEFIRFPILILAYLFFIGIVVSWMKVFNKKFRGSRR